MDNTLTVRLQLRYDTYNAWMNSTLILLPGEVAISAMYNQNTLFNTDILPENTPPAIGIKIGDGYHRFDELPWLQALAADVYEWAKSSTPPPANKIPGLESYLDNYVITNGLAPGSGGGASGTSSSYRIYYDSNLSKYILQYYDETNDEWQPSSGNQIDLSAILERLNIIERWANGAKFNLGNIELPLTAFVQDEVIIYLNSLDVDDLAVEHKFVTQVRQVDGRVVVSRSTISANDITGGILSTANGGTGLSVVEENEVLIGSNNGAITTKTFVSTIDVTDRNSFVTAGAIIDYVATMTAGLTGAMHFIGESAVDIDLKTNNHVDPQIYGYDFIHAQPGDVILANNSQELVWTGSEWRLLGDEGSYAIKGSIKNIDIAEDAAIEQSKISGLIEILRQKVNAEDIDLNAQENTIEHIYVNNAEIAPRTINNVEKVVNIEFLPYTQEEKEKLQGIQAEAQVNTLETITINGNDYTPDENKNISVTIDQAALDLDVLTGARVPELDSGGYEEVNVTQDTKILELARIAKTGNVSDLLQTDNTYIILDCGTHTNVI